MHYHALRHGIKQQSRLTVVIGLLAVLKDTGGPVHYCFVVPLPRRSALYLHAQLSVNAEPVESMQLITDNCALIVLHCYINRKLTHSMMAVASAVSQHPKPACMSQHVKRAYDTVDGVRIPCVSLIFICIKKGSNKSLHVAPHTAKTIRHCAPPLCRHHSQVTCTTVSVPVPTVRVIYNTVSQHVHALV